MKLFIYLTSGFFSCYLSEFVYISLFKQVIVIFVDYNCTEAAYAGDKKAGDS